MSVICFIHQWQVLRRISFCTFIHGGNFTQLQTSFGQKWDTIVVKQWQLKWQSFGLIGISKGIFWYLWNPQCLVGRNLITGASFRLLQHYEDRKCLVMTLKMTIFAATSDTRRPIPRGEGQKRLLVTRGAFRKLVALSSVVIVAHTDHMTLPRRHHFLPSMEILVKLIFTRWIIIKCSYKWFQRSVVPAEKKHGCKI